MTDHSVSLQQTDPSTHADSAITRTERAVLLIAVLIISICALTYELIVATLSSYLLGNSITQFSFTIGFFLFAMGLGALLSRRVKTNELRWFIIVEIAIGAFGGTSAIALFAVFATSQVYYTTTMLFFSLAIGICVGLEIPLLTRIIADRADLGNALADILSVDYIGALVASLAFPILLLPALGVTLTAFLMGLFNLLVAVILLYRFGYRLNVVWKRNLWLTCAVVAVGMIIGAVNSTQILSYFEQRLYFHPIVYKAQTPYQNIVMTHNGLDTRLYIEGNLQFSSRDEYRYHEVLVHPVMSAARNHERVLVLGGGDGMVARELLKYEDVQEIVIVDLDPAITDLARENRLVRQVNGDSMNDPRVTIINADAYTYVEQDGDLFPVVIIDLPDPNNESLSKLYSRQFYSLLHQRLTPDGVFVTQSGSPYFVREAFWMIANTVTDAGFDVLPMHTYIPSFGEWGFVLGGMHTTPQVSMPENIDDLRYLTPEVLIAAQAFDPDIAYLDTDINTLNNPVLPRVYEQGWNQWN